MIKAIYINQDNQIINTIVNENENDAKAMILDSVVDFECEVLLHFEDSFNTETYIIQTY